MKKRILTAILVSVLFASYSANAEFYKYNNLNATPESVYFQPYMDSQYTTTYTPWLKLFHLTSDNEIKNGVYGGEGSQQVRALAMSPVNPDIAYFITNTSGIWTTKNGGKNWYNTNNNYPGVNPKGLVCDPIDENTVYAQCGMTGVARSSDGGKTWYEVIPGNDSRQDQHSGNLEVDAQGNLYAAFCRGIFKLDRKTQNVTNFLPEYDKCSGNTGPSFYHLAVSSDGQHIYAAARTNSDDKSVKQGIYTSHDGGKTFAVKFTTEDVEFNAYSVAVHPENPLEVYATGYMKKKEAQSSEPFALYVSYNGGDTWESDSNQTYENLAEGVKKKTVTFYGLEFGPKNENGVYPLYWCKHNSTWPTQVSYDYGKSSTPLFTKENKMLIGTTWEALDGRPETGYLWQPVAVDMTKPGRVLFGMSNIFEWDNGIVTRKSSGFSGASVSDIAMNSKGEIVLSIVDRKMGWSESGTFSDDSYPSIQMIGYAKVGYSKEGSNAWTNTTVLFDPNDDNHVWMFVQDSNAKPDFKGVRESFDKGRNWQQMHPDTAIEREKFPYHRNHVFCYDPSDSNTIYTSNHTSHDNGKTWTRNKVTVIAMTDDCTRWLGMKGSGKEEEFYISDDRGESWVLVAKPGLGTTNYKSIFFDDADRDTIWMISATRFGKVNIKEGKFINLSSRLGSFKELSMFEQNPNNPKHMILASRPDKQPNDKCFRITETRDGGETWKPILGMFSAGYFTSAHFIGNRVYIGGHQGTLIYDYNKYWEFTDNRITIMYNDKEVSFEQEPEITNGRTMVPMRALFELLGAEVNYDSKTRLITARKGGTQIYLTPGEEKAVVGEKEVLLDAPAYISRIGRTLVPVRFIAEALDVRVGWDGTSRTVYLVD